MKNLTTLILLSASILLGPLSQTHARLHTIEEEVGSGMSGGNDSIYEYYNRLIENKTTRKDLRERNIENLHQGKKELVITIDDGPTPGVTDKILDSLKKYNVQAVFFVIGEKVQRSSANKALLERMYSEGHIVANHTMTHKNIGDIRGLLKKRKIKEEIITAHELLEPYMKNGKRWYFRAPYGSWQKRAAAVINETEYGYNYYGPLLWDIGGSMDASLFKVKRAADWSCWSKRWSVKKCLRGYIYETDEKKGGVILFHDLRSKSAELIEGYLKEYSQRTDYKFVSLDDVEL